VLKNETDIQVVVNYRRQKTWDCVLMNIVALMITFTTIRPLL
jgi:hypothetical protein